METTRFLNWHFTLSRFLISAFVIISSKQSTVTCVDCFRNTPSKITAPILSLRYSVANFDITSSFRVLAFVGLRKGEALPLTWEDIDFSNNTITINKL